MILCSIHELAGGGFGSPFFVATILVVDSSAVTEESSVCAGGDPLMLGMTPYLFTVSHFKGGYNHFAPRLVHRLGKIIKVHVLPRFVRCRGRPDNLVDVLCNVAVMPGITGVVS
jgi:hypothetical protein